MSEIVHIGAEPRTAVEIRAHVNRVQEVMRAVMKTGTHYGVIPGCDKPSLWKPGAEVLFSTFRIAVDLHVDDLSGHDEVRYRVRATATHEASGTLLGSAWGECSSSEEKYRWRRAVCAEEFAEVPEDRKRRKWRKGRECAYQTDEVRTSPSDVANTVLKMAAKRAEVALCLRVTAASDIFTQDIEDVPAELRETANETAPSVQMPRRASAAPKPAAPAPNPAAVVESIDVADVVEKSGTTKAGKPWKLWSVKAADGRTFGTFSESLGTVAQDAKEQGLPLLITSHNTERGHQLDSAVLDEPAA